jgi:hypothetical protein
MPHGLAPPLPHVRAHPEVLEVFRALGVGEIGADEAFSSLCAVVSGYLWPLASERHGYVIGELLDTAIRATIEWAVTRPADPRDRLVRIWQCAAGDPPSDLAAARGVRRLASSAWQYFGSTEPGQEGAERIAEKLDRLFPGARYPFDDGLVSPFEQEIDWPEFRSRLREFYLYPDEP